jgi:predicted acyl esterase
MAWRKSAAKSAVAYMASIAVAAFISASWRNIYHHNAVLALT